MHGGIGNQDVDILKPDDRKNVFHWENISVDSAKINWERIKKEGKRIKHFYVELSHVTDMSIRWLILRLHTDKPEPDEER
jgi:hypothetical protein